MPDLSINTLYEEAKRFSEIESAVSEPSLFGVTDGKAVGTYLEHKFTAFLTAKYKFDAGNSASGIDLPSLEVDIKVTSIKQPQSSCPFKSARQKIFGLGYHLLVFVYEKTDDHALRTGRLDIKHTIFVSREKTGDYQMTRSIQDILSREGNEDDLVALFHDKNLPLDDVECRNLANDILKNPPNLGYLTISNALQWRLQYGRIIQVAGDVEGVVRIR